MSTICRLFGSGLAKAQRSGLAVNRVCPAVIDAALVIQFLRPVGPDLRGDRQRSHKWHLRIQLPAVPAVAIQHQHCRGRNLILNWILEEQAQSIRPPSPENQIAVSSFRDLSP